MGEQASDYHRGEMEIQEQLATFDATFPFVSGQYLQFTYRVVGSVNGFEEHRDWSIPFATAADMHDVQNREVKKLNSF